MQNNLFFLDKPRLKKVWKFAISPFVRVNESPIIILGNQKSGTSAIAALLAYCTGCSVTIDLLGLYEPVQTSIHSEDIKFEDFVRANKYDFSRDIIKEPCLTFLYPKVKNFFQNPKFLMVIRDARNNIRSILNRLGIRGDLRDVDTTILSHVTREWKLVLNGQWLGLEGETYIELLAARWNRAADVYLDNANEMLLLRYEDFDADKVGAIERIAAELELKRINDISDRVDIQYQPRGDRAVSWEVFFGTENLKRIEHICGDRLRAFQYI